MKFQDIIIKFLTVFSVSLAESVIRECKRGFNVYLRNSIQYLKEFFIFEILTRYIFIKSKNEKPIVFVIKGITSYFSFWDMLKSGSFWKEVTLTPKFEITAIKSYSQNKVRISHENESNSLVFTLDEAIPMSTDFWRHFL